MAKVREPKRIAWESAAAVGSLRWKLKKKIDWLVEEAEAVWCELENDAHKGLKSEAELFRVFCELNNEALRLQLEYESLPPWE